MAQVDGKKVKIGDFVSFKYDIEMTGKITKINGRTLTIMVIDDCENENFYQEDSSRCWIE